MVSVPHMHVSLLVWNTLSDLYLLNRGVIYEQVSLCIVLVIVSIACLRPIFHRSLSSWGDTVEWRPFDWNFLLLFCRFWFRYINWWYQSKFDTANHLTCNGTNAIDLVHWIAVSEVKGSSLRHIYANVPLYLLLHSTRALGEADILWIPLVRWRIGSMWKRL